MFSRRSFLKASGSCLVLPALLSAPGTLLAAPSHLRVRKNLMTLPDNDPFFEAYGEAVAKMHEIDKDKAPTERRLTSWFGQATIHANWCKHGDINFCSWHRPYLAMFEEICGSQIGDPTFALHYWNWSEKGGIIPNPFYDNNNLNVTYWNDPGTYDGIGWGDIDTRGVRGLAKGTGVQADPNRGGNFSTDILANIMSQPTFKIFSNLLEGQPHNNAHVIVGAVPEGKQGHMYSGLSPLDPIFWMHHCMVDFMWARWQDAGNKTMDRAETFANQFVNPQDQFVTFSSEGVRDYAALGYTYEGNVVPSALVSALALAPIDSAAQESMARRLESVAPVTLAASSDTIKVMTNKTVSLSASVPRLKSALDSTSVFSVLGPDGPAVVAGPKQVYAVVKGITWPTGPVENLIVNAFVNNPDANPSTPSSDPSYAGTFTFFGSRKMMENMQHDHGVIFDITEALRAKGGSVDDVSLQLVPLNPVPGTKSEASFEIGGFEIFTA
ncbi:MAG: tyrosinase family protein [Magnetovibrionaceae bacterium]